MTRWKLTIEYDGTDYSGWQIQANAPSVQAVIEKAIKEFSEEDVNLHAAGRTDAKVHAHNQIAHFDLIKESQDYVVRDALNFYLRFHKISILKAEAVDERFHARFSALGRAYHYIIINRRAPLTFQSNYAWHIIKPLDLKLMREAAHTLLGTHDFSTFRAQYCQAKSPIRTLDQLNILEEEEGRIVIEAKARSFLYHQVRNMVGTLSMIGSGDWTLNEFAEAFKACDRAKGGPTAPAQGLYLWSVAYAQ